MNRETDMNEELVRKLRCSPPHDPLACMTCHAAGEIEELSTEVLELRAELGNLRKLKKFYSDTSVTRLNKIEALKAEIELLRDGQYGKLQRRIDQLQPVIDAVLRFKKGDELHASGLPDAVEELDARSRAMSDVLDNMKLKTLQQENLSHAVRKVDQPMITPELQKIIDEYTECIWYCPNQDCKAINKELEPITILSELVCCGCEREWLASDVRELPVSVGVDLAVPGGDKTLVREPKEKHVDTCEPHRKFPCRKCGTKHYEDCRCPYCVCKAIRHALTGPLKCSLSDGHEGTHSYERVWTAADTADYKAVLRGEMCGQTIETVSNRIQTGHCNLKKDHDGLHQWMMPLPDSEGQ